MKADDYSSIRLFDKQIEFFEKLMPVLHEVNCYTTAIDVWSGETGKAAGKQLRKALKKDACLRALQELLWQYYVYIPENLSSQINQLHLACMKLENAQTQDATARCTDQLFALQENIRKFIQHIPNIKGGG